MCRTRVQVATEAVVLDMGLYSLPGFPFQHAADVAGLLPAVPGAQPSPAGASAAAWSSTHTTSAAGTGSASATQQSRSTDTAGAPAASVMPARNVQSTPAGAPAVFNDLLLPSTAPTSASAATAPAVGDLMGCLRFYQILPPKLMERAHIFGNKCVFDIVAVVSCCMPFHHSFACRVSDRFKFGLN